MLIYKTRFKRCLASHYSFSISQRLLLHKDNRAFTFPLRHVILVPMKKLTIFLLKPLSFLPAILMMYMIFQFSAQTGEVSGQLSYDISYKIVEIKDELLGTEKSYDDLAAEADSIHYYVRKAAHMTVYFLLAIAVSFPLYVYRIRGIWLMLLAGIICVVFAGLDEYHQSFVAGRGPSLKDVGIDSIGAFVGILLVQAFCWSTMQNPGHRKSRRKKHRW